MGNGNNLKPAIYVDYICVFCGKDYKRKSTIQSISKYCSRKCKDLDLCNKFKGSCNPSFGKKQSQETREKRSKSVKKAYKNQETKEKHKLGLKLAKEKLGHYPGTSDIDKEKRRKTTLERYGVDHNWKNKSVRAKCEETSLRLYGKYTWEIARDSIKKKNTSIEIIIAKTLNSMNIDFVQSFNVFDDNRKRYFEFDFFIPSLNLLIEADGDYWHANPALYEKDKLNKTQMHTNKNDLIKNDIADRLKIKLLRFWETDIRKDDFKNILSEALCQEK